MKNISVVVIGSLVVSGAVLLGFFGVENAIARRPAQSSLDQVISSVADAKPGLTEVKETEAEVPSQVADFLQDSF